MKQPILTLFILFIFNTFYAQEKYDFTWVLGYPPNDKENGYGGNLIDFNGEELITEYFNTPIFIDNSAQICGKDGQLLFYSNGCKIVNGNHQLISNGYGLNPGEFYDSWCTEYDISYDTRQGLIALPWPGRESQYILFHMGWHQLSTSPYTVYLQNFYYTHIDMSANNGAGQVIDKNHQLLYDTNLIDNITAVRHGNGRDWWIVAPRGKSDAIYLFLLSPQGIEGPYEQHTGDPTSLRGFTAGQIVFSPDGTKFIRVSASSDGVDIMNFDRCSGVFSCFQRLPFPSLPEGAPCGAAVSPNSRYLYISATTQMFQYDMWSSSIEKSKVLIGEYDGFKGPYNSTTFYQQKLGPDGKIYMSASSSMRYLHVIHRPDLPGNACDFRQHDVYLPATIGFCLPNFPYFRLYDVPGSPCDTLGIDAPAGYAAPAALAGSGQSMLLYPNPVSNLLKVEFPQCLGGMLRIFNMSGQQLLTREIGRQPEHIFDCSAWPAGVYVVSFCPAEDNCKPVSAKLVVTR